MTAPAGWLDLGDRDHPEHYAMTQPSEDAVTSLRLALSRLADGSWRLVDFVWPLKSTHRTQREALVAADVRMREVPNGLTRLDFASVWVSGGSALKSGLDRGALDRALRVGRVMWVEAEERSRQKRRVDILERALGLAPVQGELFGGGGM